MEIRHAETSDIPELAKIHSTSLISAFGDFFPKEIVNEKFSVRYREKGFLKEMEKGEPENIIAFHAGKPAGLLSYGKCRYTDLPKTTVELWRIYMMPGLQGMGLGKELLEFGMREMSAKGYLKVILWVLEENMRARKFYEKNGFSHKGVTMDAYYGMDITDLMYEKTLTPADAAGTGARQDDKNSVDLV